VYILLLKPQSKFQARYFEPTRRQRTCVIGAEPAGAEGEKKGRSAYAPRPGPGVLPELLAAGNHIIHRGDHFLVRTVHATALGHHRRAGHAVQAAVVEDIGALGNAVRPGRGVP